MSIQLLSSLVLLVADETVSEAISSDGISANFQEIGRSLIGCAIWIPYLNISQRVKDTFIVRSDNNGGDEPPHPQYEVSMADDGRQDTSDFRQQ